MKKLTVVPAMMFAVLLMMSGTAQAVPTEPTIGSPKAPLHFVPTEPTIGSPKAPFRGIVARFVPTEPTIGSPKAPLK